MTSLRSILFALAVCLGCGPAPHATPAPPPPPPPPAATAAPMATVDEAYFAGVWTTSTVSYDAAARATEATRFGADGTLANGVWGANGFTAGPAVGPSRGFVARHAIDVAAKTITFFLDGAEEHATFVIDGKDQWKTVATTPEGTFVVYYRRRP